MIRPAAPQERADAREELREGERLHEVIVGAAVEAADPIVDRVPGGEDEDGGLQPALAQCRQDLDAIAMGKHEIEHDAIERLVVDEKEAFLARGREADVVMLGFEAFTQGLRHLLFVFDDQHAHRAQHYIGASMALHLTTLQ